MDQLEARYAAAISDCFDHQLAGLVAKMPSFQSSVAPSLTFTEPKPVLQIFGSNCKIMIFACIWICSEVSSVSVNSMKVCFYSLIISFFHHADSQMLVDVRHLREKYLTEV
jgi:hypothetical protein